MFFMFHFQITRVFFLLVCFLYWQSFEIILTKTTRNINMMKFLISAVVLALDRDKV